LIRLIGLWMSERGFDTLDFGAGGEAYKARYANAEEPLWRIYAAPRRLSRWYARGLVEERIRRSPRLQRLWDRWVNVRLRAGAVVRRWLRAPTGRRASSGGQTSCFWAAGRGPTTAASVTALDPFAVLARLEQAGPVTAQERAAVHALHAGGGRAFGTVADGRVLQFAWLSPLDPTTLPEGTRLTGRARWHIAGWVADDGLAHLRPVLAGILELLSAEDVAVTWAEADDSASQAAVLAAGFVEARPA